MPTEFASVDRVALLRILQHLPHARDVASMGATCSSVRDLGRTDLLWQERLLSDFDLAVEACPGQELQAVYAKLANCKKEYYLRFLGAYTDGGCDNLDLTYWVDHVFMPNHWYPFCSESGSNISCVGLLKAHAHADDEASMQHRSYLVDRCKYAAALLFGPPQDQRLADPAAALNVLAGWSTAGLERLFVDLHQDLVVHGPNSTWGRLLLRGVAPGREEQERERLQERFQYITQEGSCRRDYTVERLPADVADSIEAAARALPAAAAAAPTPSSPPSTAAVAPTTPPAAAGGATAGSSGASTSAATVATAATAGGGGAAAAGSRAGTQQPGQRRSRLCDSKALPLFGSEELAASTACVREMSVSRCGHFTCPVRCGAIFLGQAPQLPASTDAKTRAAALASVPLDPFVAALDDVCDLDTLHTRISSGVLPPLAMTAGLNPKPKIVIEDHVEWAEFGPLSLEQRRARAARGWHMRPVVWFRFLSKQEVETSAVGQAMDVAEQQILEQGEPMYDDDYDYDESDDGGDDEGADDEGDMLMHDQDSEDDSGSEEFGEDGGAAGATLAEFEDAAGAAADAAFHASVAAAATAALYSASNASIAAAMHSAADATAVGGPSAVGDGSIAGASIHGGLMGNLNGGAAEGQAAVARQSQGDGAGPSSSPALQRPVPAPQHGHEQQQQQQQQQQQPPAAGGARSLTQAAQQAGAGPGPSSSSQHSNAGQQQPNSSRQYSDGAGPSGSSDPPPLPPSASPNAASPLQRLTSVTTNPAAAASAAAAAPSSHPLGASSNGVTVGAAASNAQEPGTSSRPPATTSGAPQHASWPTPGRTRSRKARAGVVDRAPRVRILPSPCLPRQERTYPMTLKVLSMRLQNVHSGNVALLKLISPEDLMQEFGDEHDDPNIDCEYAAFKGFAVQLPPGSRLV